MNKSIFFPEFESSYKSGSQYYPYVFGDAGYDPSSVNRIKENWRSYEDQQFGDAYDGSMRIAGRTLSDGSKLVIPYPHVENIRRKSFDIGVSAESQISYQ